MFKPAPYQTQVLIEHKTEFETPGNVSVFDRELSLDELLHPSKFHLCHHVPHFSILLVQVSTALFAMSALELVINSKFVRTNCDAFVFHGRYEPVQKLKANSRLDDVSFKHFVFTEVHGNRRRIINSCDNEADFRQELQISTNPCGTQVDRKHIVGAAYLSPWYRPSDESKEWARGSFHKMLMEASVRLNFTFSVVIIRTSGMKVNGTWTEGMGDVFYRRVHTVLSKGVTESRNFAIDGCGLLCWFNTVFWVRTYSGRQNAGSILKPFNISLWILTFAVLLLFGTMLYCLSKTQSNADVSLSCVVETVVRNTLEQDIKLHKCTSRTSFLLYLLLTFNIVTLTSYRSKLYDVLMFKNLEPFPTNFNQLAFSEYKLTFRSYGAVKAQLARSKTAILIAQCCHMDGPHL